jgi:uncharacterized LabA/DUF88 family protein
MAANLRPAAKIEAEEPTQRLAVLIDADNAQAAVIGGLLAEIARFGEATVKRIYGDFTASSSAQWKKVLNQYAIKPVQQFAYTSGKNATDSTLIIDAMDLLYTRRFDGFCLVSSDSDFTGLAVRIREEGLMVYGFGEQKTPEAFRNACHKFLFTEVLRPVAAPKGKPLGIAKSKKKGSGAVPSSANGTGSPAAPQPLSLAAMHQGHPRPEDVFFRQALEQVSDEQGWVHLGQFGNYLKKLRPDFDARNFGYKKLSDLVRARADLFAVDEREVAGTTTKSLYVRAR